MTKDSPYLAGTSVQPSKFYGHAASLAGFFSWLRQDQLAPIRIIGMRRSGKTSFLKKAADRATLDHAGFDDSVRVIYVTMQGLSGPDAFAELVARRLDRSKTVQTVESLNRWLEDEIFPQTRLVLLLDEFDSATEESTFDGNFFDRLRAVTDEHSTRFSIVATCWRGPRRSLRTQYFWSLTRPDPIYIGPFTHTEAEQLVCGLAEGQHEYSGDDVEEILRLAGTLPFFIQSVAGAWLSQPVSTRGKKRSGAILSALLHEDNSVCQNISLIWDRLDPGERESIENVVAGSTPLGSVDRLESLGLLVHSDDLYRVNGRVLENWVRQHASEENDTAQAAGVRLRHDLETIEPARGYGMLKCCLADSDALPSALPKFERFESETPVQRAISIWLAEYCFKQHRPELESFWLQLADRLGGEDIPNDAVKAYSAVFGPNELKRQMGKTGLRGPEGPSKDTIRKSSIDVYLRETFSAYYASAGVGPARLPSDDRERRAKRQAIEQSDLSESERQFLNDNLDNFDADELRRRIEDSESDME
ncbi:MAG: ATP-binding protein [bacterium]|nr:ATP-binding protein [bacterium]